MLGVRKKVDELVSTFRDIAQENERLKDENAKLRELVRNLVYAEHPLDRAKLIENAVGLGVEQ